MDATIRKILLFISAGKIFISVFVLALYVALIALQHNDLLVLIVEGSYGSVTLTPTGVMFLTLYFIVVFSIGYAIIQHPRTWQLLVKLHNLETQEAVLRVCILASGVIAFADFIQVPQKEKGVFFHILNLTNVTGLIVAKCILIARRRAMEQRAIYLCNRGIMFGTIPASQRTFRCEFSGGENSGRMEPCRNEQMT
ncbi:solute carrier family 2, facilitated glucose transporter member 6-like isoform X1 [Hemicordylus capensis]|uniref:solute carrier family 2, facilitated glucose transporter member 6-like isoform X1 n=1 Tax=Hemicordylus capensis TaxID=884348 RepID=UPI002303C273|nr:solute carrier family 2, facilitated glucose transporter member 6-like isoform X1 [Hemicordylus capensis]